MAKKGVNLSEAQRDYGQYPQSCKPWSNLAAECFPSPLPVSSPILQHFPFYYLPLQEHRLLTSSERLDRSSIVVG